MDVAQKIQLQEMRLEIISLKVQNLGLQQELLDMRIEKHREDIRKLKTT